VNTGRLTHRKMTPVIPHKIYSLGGHFMKTTFCPFLLDYLILYCRLMPWESFTVRFSNDEIAMILGITLRGILFFASKYSARPQG
jgi:hypothetical protein